MRVAVLVGLILCATFCYAGTEEFCLRWNSPSVCFFETVYPLDTSEDFVEFYQYTKPFGSSANTGLEVSGITQVFLLKDVVGVGNSSLALVMIHDKPQDSTGGSLNVDFEVDGFTMPVDPFIVRDDVTHTLDGYSYSQGTNTGNAFWGWGSCCTDGMTLGPIPDPTNITTPFSIKLKYNQLVSSDDSSATNGPPWSLGVRFRTAPPLQPTKLMTMPIRDGTPYHEIELYSGACTPRPTCDLPCYECQANPECGWCGTTQTCHDRTCDIGFTNCTAAAQDSTCPTATYCGAREGCAECNVESVCGICTRIDNSTGTPMFNQSCIATNELLFGFTSCDGGFNSSFAFCPVPPSPPRNITRTNITQQPPIDLNTLVPPPSPGKGIPVWIWIAIAAAVFLLILVVAFLIWKLARVQQEVMEILAFDDADAVKSNPLFEAQETEGLNPLYEKAM